MMGSQLPRGVHFRRRQMSVAVEKDPKLVCRSSPAAPEFLKLSEVAIAMITSLRSFQAMSRTSKNNVVILLINLAVGSHR